MRRMREHADRHAGAGMLDAGDATAGADAGEFVTGETPEKFHVKAENAPCGCLSEAMLPGIHAALLSRVT
jgi:hypothetical protein